MAGHGWVIPNADGSKARCGGPAICSQCALDYAQQHYRPLRCTHEATMFISVYDGPFYRFCDEHLGPGARAVEHIYSGLLTLSLAEARHACDASAVLRAVTEAA